MAGQLIDRALYELIYAAVVGEKDEWAALFSALSARLHTTAISIYKRDYGPPELDILYVHGLDREVLAEEYENLDFRLSNPWRKATPLNRVGKVRTDDDLKSWLDDPELLTATPFYRGWAKKFEVEHTIGTSLRKLHGSLLNVTCFRATRFGPFNAEERTFFDELAFHLQQLLKVNDHRLPYGFYRNTADTVFAALDVAIAELDASGRVLHLNPAAERLIEKSELLSFVRGRPRLSDSHEDARLQHALQALAQRETMNGVSNCVRITAAGGESERRVELVLLRLPEVVSPLAPQASIVAVVTEHPRSVSAKHLKQRFALKHGEAEILALLAAGYSLRKAAAERNLTYETARSYLKRALSKTQTHSQSEVVSLILSDPLTDFARTAGENARIR